MDKIDRSEMLAQIQSFPKQLLHQKAVTRSNNRYLNVAICGMGVSGMAGEIISDLLSTNGSMPIINIKNSKVPSSITKESLVVMVSYSGDTKETLDCFESAMARGIRPYCISSGGLLEKKAKENDLPHLKIPSGLQPRSALGYILSQLAVILETNEIGDIYSQIAESYEWLTSTVVDLYPEVPVASNKAMIIATYIGKEMPVIYSPTGIGSIAVRWQNQICENSKTLAFSGEIPEMCHNQLEAWLSSASPDSIKPIILRPANADAQVHAIIAVLAEMFSERGFRPMVVDLPGQDEIQNILYGVVLGDMVSYYISVLKDEDPMPIKSIKDFKNRLEQRHA